MRAAVLACVLLLSACGFQLQGRRAMPSVLSTMHLQVVDEQSDFTRALRTALKASGSRLVPARTAEGATVRIVRDEFTEHVLSVDARNIPTDIVLTYRVEVEVRAGGAELMAMEPFEVSRNYSFDVSILLAKEGEEDILREDLARDLASVVTRRLAAL
jgi:LPS-assembly lipoprotein